MLASRNQAPAVRGNARRGEDQTLGFPNSYDEQSTRWFSGKSENNGRFEITVPYEIEDEDVQSFRVAGTPLQINQRSPWKLSPILEAVLDK